MKKAMKRLASLTLALLLLLALLPGGAMAADVVASGSCGAEGDNLTWTLDSAGTLTISGVGAMQDFESGLTPWGSPNVSKVVIKKGVTTIGAYAFEGWNSLKSVTIPTTVTTIGDSAFSNSGLTSITVPYGVTSIGSNAFQSCTSLSYVSLPEGLDKIGGMAFLFCLILESIEIPSTVTEIGYYAFYYCNALKSVTIPEGVTSIGYNAFYNCPELTSVTIPASVTSIGSGVFGYCTSLMSINVAQNNEKYCSVDGVLFNKDMSEIIAYPGGKSGDYSIPESVTYLGSGVFDGCSGLTAVTLPKDIRVNYYSYSYGDYSYDYGYSPFTNCTSLKKIIVDPENSSLCSKTGVLFDKDKSRLISYPAAKAGEYVVPESVAVIGQSAFYGCSGLTGITLPEGLEYINNDAFYNCKGLAGVMTIPDSVTKIDSYAFYGCSGLTQVTIPASVTTIGNGAFANCSSLAKIQVSTENGYFRSASGVLFNKAKTSLVAFPGGKQGAYELPSSVTEIGSYAFYYCAGVTSVTIPEGVTNISSNAFYFCSNLTSVMIPSSVSEIETYAFAYCYNLTSVMLSQGVTAIKSYAFYDCYSLSQITIPEGVTEIAQNAFGYCSSLRSVELPVSLKTIAPGAFSNCPLTDVHYASNKIAWNRIDFGNTWDQSLTPVNINYGNAPAPAEPLELVSITPDKTSAKTGETITWTAKTTGGNGTLKYRFYIYRDGNAVQKGDYGQANTVSYTPTEAGTYTVRVYAKDADGSLSLTGGDVMVSVPQPTVPTNLTVTSTLNGITVSWDAASGAVKYRVIRTVDGVTTKYKVTGTTWTDTEVEADKNYIYSVQSQTADGAYSEASETKSLYYPLGIAVKVSGSLAKVSWTAVAGATKYQMYRRPQVNGKYGDWELIYSAKGTSFVDTPGEGIWQYRVRAVVDDVKTAYSNRKRVTINGDITK